MITLDVFSTFESAEMHHSGSEDLVVLTDFDGEEHEYLLSQMDEQTREDVESLLPDYAMEAVAAAGGYLGDGEYLPGYEPGGEFSEY